MTGKPAASAVRQRFGDLAPHLVELTERVVLGEMWDGDGMSKRDRSLVILSALVALNRTEQLGPYMRRSLKAGLGRDEIVELITQLAFYAGWPVAMSALGVARMVFDEAEQA